MPLTDLQCLFWVKDPTISPYTRADIRNKNTRNPDALFNEVRNTCYHNTALRQQIIDKIKEYQRNPLRLYTLNDKDESFKGYIGYEYNFSKEECIRWIEKYNANPRINPRTNEILNFNVYIELIYTAIQYGISLKHILDDKNTIKYFLEIIKDIEKRHHIMKENDAYFLAHRVVPPHPSLPPDTKKKKDKVPKYSFGVSTSSSVNSLNASEKIRLGELILKNEKKKALVADFELTRKRNIFQSLILFYDALEYEITNGIYLLNAIMEDVKLPIMLFYEDSKIGNLTGLDILRKYIYLFIRNIYSKKPRNTEHNLSLTSRLFFNDDSKKLFDKINDILFEFIDTYKPTLDFNIKKYLKNIIRDVIPIVHLKYKKDTMGYDLYYNNTEAYNLYYTTLKHKVCKMLRLPGGVRLPEGMGLMTKVNRLENGSIHEEWLIDEKAQNGFTYDECKVWVLMPIVNPRTFKPILIDSPLYNRLLCMSFQYDTELIPRMITAVGWTLLYTLYKNIIAILKAKGVPQTREQLEEFVRVEEVKANIAIAAKKTAKAAIMTVTENKAIHARLIHSRKEEYMFKKIYTVVECLRWARQPNKDPIKGTLILTDGKEYNMIFEQAILFDSNIQPMDITSKGIEFKKSVENVKKKIFGVMDRESTESNDEVENDDVCKLFRNIYDGDEYYKLFKKKVKKVCLGYHKKDVVCMDKIKSSIVKRFTTDVPTEDEDKYRFNYFVNSALASIIIYYNSMVILKYDKTYQNLFTNNFRIFKIFGTYEIDDELKFHKKEAVDAGGPIRDFFTKLFEELFCDEEHPTRPFICPKDNIENRYYINPNFALDEDFKKVFVAKKIDIASIDYDDIYTIIGKLLCVTFVNEEIKLPKQLSTYIIAGLIKNPMNITNYDLLYIYVNEFNNAPVYLNMIKDSQIEYIDDLGMDFNDNYIISKTGHKVRKDNFIKFILQLAKHIVTKNFLGKDDALSVKSMKMRYVSLFAGFNNELRTFLANNRVGVEQLNSMITYKKMDDAILQEFARKINIYMEGINTLTVSEKDEKVQEMRRYITNIITNNKERKDSDEDHYVFIRRLLRFWTGLPNYEKDTNYTIFYKYGHYIIYSYNEEGNEIHTYNVNNLPVAATCFNQLDIFGFPTRYKSPQSREKYIYHKLKLAVEATGGIELR
jgi:hypothetical protein